MVINRGFPICAHYLSEAKDYFWPRKASSVSQLFGKSDVIAGLGKNTLPERFAECKVNIYDPIITPGILDKDILCSFFARMNNYIKGKFREIYSFKEQGCARRLHIPCESFQLQN